MAIRRWPLVSPAWSKRRRHKLREEAAARLPGRSISSSLRVLAKVGSWESLLHREEGVETCCLHGIIPDGGLLALTLREGGAGELGLALIRGAWRWPPGVQVPVTFEFSDRVALVVPGAGDGITISAEMSPTQAARVLDWMATCERMAIRIAAVDDPVWSFDLFGARIAIDAMMIGCAERRIPAPPVTYDARAAG